MLVGKINSPLLDFTTMYGNREEIMIEVFSLP